MKKKGRPVSKNAFYFPHYTKSSKELDLIEFRHGSKGYKAYYKLLEIIADADFHTLSVKTKDEKDMFDLGIGVPKKVYMDVIQILINSNRIDRQIWEDQKIIWMEDFVQTLRPLYANRRKPLPTKESISTCNKVQKRKGKERKKKKREEEQSTPISISEFQDVYPDIDITHSLNKLYLRDPDPSIEEQRAWLEIDKKNGWNKKKPEFLTSDTGLFIAYCSNCGDKHFPNDKWQLKERSGCCRAKYVPNKPENNEK